jgi:hypothetical protein
MLLQTRSRRLNYRPGIKLSHHLKEKDDWIKEALKVLQQ